MLAICTKVPGRSLFRDELWRDAERAMGEVAFGRSKSLLDMVSGVRNRASRAGRKPVVEVLAEAQWRKDLFANVPGDAESGEPLIQYLRLKQAELASSWRVRYDPPPFPSWNMRVQRIRQEKGGRKALVSYDRLHDEIAYYNSYIKNAVGIVDRRADEASERHRQERRK